MRVGLFSRRKRTHEREDLEPEAGTDEAPEADIDEAPEADTDEEPRSGADDAEPPAEGPYDEADAPEEDRIDLGGLQVPLIDGMELRLEMDQRTRAVTGANLVLDGSSLQLQAFAAPKSTGLWDEVRSALRDSVVSQGGTAETRSGPFGTELLTRLPVKRSDGRTGYRPARFIGVDGPRWFVRAILSGKAVGESDLAERFETILARTVVVRGSEAMAPQELIPLNLPGQRPGLVQNSSPIDPLGRGPEIAEIR